MAKILIVEDEKAIADIVAFNLSREGFEIVTAYEGTSGLSHALDPATDLVLLDVMLPGIGGFEICKRVREKSGVPIIMLTAREEETDKVLGLELGADDYITKPFSMRELIARIHANLRRTVTEQPSASAADFSCGDIEIFYSSHEVRRGGAPLELTAREYEILRYMTENSGRVISREELMSKVWEYEYYGDLRAVDVAICRVRDKIESDPTSPKYIVTKRGVGYVFVKDGNA